jgi:hypothetical protein
VASRAEAGTEDMGNLSEADWGLDKSGAPWAAKSARVDLGVANPRSTEGRGFRGAEVLAGVLRPILSLALSKLKD